MNIAVGMLVLAVAGFALLNWMARRHAIAMLTYRAGGERTASPERLSRFQRALVLLRGVNVPRPVASATPADRGLAFEEGRIKLDNGICLSYWRVPREGAKGLAMLFHGYSTEKSALLPEAAMFHELGYEVFLVDFRGSGGSSESYTTIGCAEAEDVAAAWRHVTADGRPPRIVMYGHSMGGVAILRAIREHGVRPDAVVVEAVFDSMLRTIGNRFNAMALPAFPGAHLMVFWGGREFGFDGFRHNPEEYARAVTCPILFIHGQDDPRARVEEGRRVFDAVPASTPKEFVEFGGVGHESCSVKYPAEWQSAVGKFLKTDR